MKKLTAIVVLVLMCITSFSQKDTTVKVPADTVDILSSKDIYDFYNRLGDQLGEKLTKNEWEVLMYAVRLEINRTVGAAVLRYNNKKAKK